LKKKLKFKFSEAIVFEDDEYIIIDKPPFISTLQDRFDSINISDLAKEYCPGAIVNHRLDKETSGLLVIAKNEEAYRHFSILLENHEVHKLYHTIVWGTHQFQEMLIEAPLLVTNSGKVRVDPAGKYSATIVKTLELFPKHSLLECKILTGKKHQIRIHLGSGGAPIIHDGTYGGDPLYLSDLKRNYKGKSSSEERPLSRRVMLHSKQLAFENQAGKLIELDTDYPSDFELILKKLRKFS